MFLSFAYALAASTSQSAVVTPPKDCEMYVRPVDENGRVRESPFITPRDISSIEFDKTDPITGFRMWRVVLTKEGASRNASYTGTHVREKIAIFCGATEISRPMIAAPSSDTFVVIIPDKVT
ncbi:hypothetical protein [Rudaea sp.]|uniref:hypothetical protein n=1 Tax=Rudaea sp. TaxID=2136325 RepID=UPI002ED4369A